MLHLVAAAVLFTAPAPPATLVELAEALENVVDPPRGASVDEEQGLLLIGQLEKDWKDASRSERRKARKELGRLVDRGGEPELRELAIRAASALGSMGRDGAKELEARLDDCLRTREPEGGHDLQRAVVLALGHTRAERALEPLEDLLHHPDAVIVAAGAEALGEFDSLEEEPRKDVFYRLLSRLIDLNDDQRDTNDLLAKQRYEAVVGAFNSSLRRLSRHDERDPDAWLRFWNNHKKDDWDAVAPEERP